MTGTFSDNTQTHRFEYDVNGSIAFAKYRRDAETLYIDYVESPQELRGTGASGRLMQNIVDFAQKEKLKIVPICGYAATWLANNKSH